MTTTGRAAAVVPACLLAVLTAACSAAAPPAPVRDAGTVPAPTASAVASATAAATTDAADGRVIVLGRPGGPYARGLGTARPALVDLGGASSTGIVEGLAWDDWGGPTATGTGTAAYAAPGQALATATRERATVVAADPGDCGGRLAYRTLTWYFPQHHEVPGAHTPLDVCGP
ncbi:hypothetical protein [Pseudonocardia spirodelae]|uniref:Uncharacterized protein n=1 Tax=Pseudonocardia spirodelae TaxID=3133431 RepID=A0ABU8T359_9PSEU